MNNPLSLTSLHPLARYAINSLTRLNTLSAWYDEWLASIQTPPRLISVEGHGFLNFVLGKLNADVLVSNQAQLDQIPADGPLLVVANHPLGAMEGMLLSRLLLRYRPDLKVLTNELLLTFPEFNDLFIGVDVLNSNAQAKNMKGMRAANRHLSSGGALLVFPAGTVSQLQLPGGTIEDSVWSPMVGRLALKHGATCLPFHIDGRNSLLFYLAGLIHKRLRTALLPRAMLGKQGTRLRITAGAVIGKETLQELGSASCVTQYLRVSCDLLKGSEGAPSTPQAVEDTADTIRPENIQAQFERLQGFLVVQRGDFSVYCMPYDALGCIADLLAREREITFRHAGEGTGKTLDRDRFDSYYSHVVAWDHGKQKLIGGYRVVRTDHAIRGRGLEGLYSHSQFRFGRQFLEMMGPSIEVGRSFITAPYQRDTRALDLLWKGIGAFVQRNSDCHTLFGCVSISARYSPLARTLLADTMLHNHVVGEQMRLLVRPAVPKNTLSRTWDKELLLAFGNVAIFNKLLGSQSMDRRVPTLIRHYLAMNGKFVEFSVNNDFNKSLDGLIVVDLRNSPVRYLQRYLGKESAERFQSRWRDQSC
ncbi:MAG: GNAT family N-acyltransferase [Gammaproteobacteria bacterium]|nr:GNAT family N-acyltransferase [Gammaproteobacteria bacterium]MDP2346442.1 GNAT family N-acyltransferase [Gammaproteobacteria bacterium]